MYNYSSISAKNLELIILTKVKIYDEWIWGGKLRSQWAVSNFKHAFRIFGPEETFEVSFWFGADLTNTNKDLV